MPAPGDKIAGSPGIISKTHSKMKMIIATVLSVSVMSMTSAQHVSSVSAASSASASTDAGFNWANTTFDFKKTKVGIPVSYEFRFTNIGMVPLIISSAKASCGCTVTAFTKEPVQKASSGFVRATYDAANVGKYTKTIAVYANTPEGTVQLTIKGEVTE
jgi:hypothetical protein